MHGRLKVRTTAEERERKKKEQALKVRAYRACMGKILAKRTNDEYDDEMMQLTVQILQRNPDISTLWNIRRQCLLKKAKDLQDEASKEGATEEASENENIEKLQAAFDSELTMTEQCLTTNPKSYCCWHQRCWTLEHSPKANWEREVYLCNKYLKYDERNFHTWDYRRYVVEKAGIEKEKELEFCTEKIKVNFSNYSSWHHRSLLLPILYPYDGDALPKRPMSESKLKEELEMVITAAFTDPNDSSAWFYQRWLLGQSRQEQGICAFRCDKDKAVLAFTQDIESKQIKASISWKAEDNATNSIALTDWLPANESKVDSIWFSNMPADSKVPNEVSLELEVHIPGKPFPKMPLQKQKNDLFCYFKPPNKAFNYSQAVRDELQSQLESCNSLLEFEPESKWTLLTSALLMREIDPVEYHAKSMENVVKLQEVDSLRVGYYKDLASKWLLERYFDEWLNSEEFPNSINLSELKDLTSLQYCQYFCIADELTLSPELDTIYKNRKLPKTFSDIGK